MSYKIAVATSDGITVDTHFGHASSFTIFEVDEETGSYTDLEEREVNAYCGGGECGSEKAESALENPMDNIAKTLSDVQYVLVAKIGPHALRSLAKHGISAYDIVLPIEEAVKKINIYRKKIEGKASCNSRGI